MVFALILLRTIEVSLKLRDRWRRRQRLKRLRRRNIQRQ